MLRPLSANRWGFAQAAHLLNRAGFSGTPADISELEALGPKRAVAELVDYSRVPEAAERPTWAKPDLERAERRQALQTASEEERRKLRQEQARLFQERVIELRGGWVQRMAHGARPLQEKMTLFWHGHFATSIQKVRDPYLMWRQLELFREHALGNWRALLDAVTTDPAMLIWLDQAQSRREHPNENYARELMELFTLGEGHYTETDVTEAARSLTGVSYNLRLEEYQYRPFFHDGGVKTFLGRTGRLEAKDVINQILAQPQAARFIARKLWSFFAQENPPDELVEALAEELRRHHYEFRPFLRTLLRSEEFYDPAIVRSQIKSPAQFLVAALRQLEREVPRPAACANALRLLGQDLLAPPNVKGWDGGQTWITTTNLLNRHNLAAALVLGPGAFPGGPFVLVARRPPPDNGGTTAPRLADADSLFSVEDRRDADHLVAALERRFLQAHLTPRSAEVVHHYLTSHGELNDHQVLQAVRLVLCTPEYQLT